MGQMGVTGYPSIAKQINGNILTVPVPFHINLYLSLCTLPLLNNNRPKITSAAKAFKDIKKLTQVTLKGFDEALVQSYAKSVYYDAALSGSTAQFRLPLDLSWEVGSRYDMSAGDGSLFRGYLSGLEHSISRGEMNTTLDFTHVEFGDYRLAT
jgi:hypothetical protein